MPCGATLQTATCGSVELCPACGSPLQPASSTAGLCPACLLEQVLAQDEDQDLDAPEWPERRETGVEGPLAPGATFGRFEIVGVLGRGGMATVYEAREAPPLERTVALKVLPPEFSAPRIVRGAIRRTKRRLVAGLEHPGIVPIYASGIDDGLPWMSMRLLRDGSLAAMLGRGLGIERTTRILRGVAEALDYAHASGVLHRDIKPTQHPARRDRPGMPQLTSDSRDCWSGPKHGPLTGTVAGTPHYMSPEQALGAPIDRAATSTASASWRTRC